MEREEKSTMNKRQKTKLVVEEAAMAEDAAAAAGEAKSLYIFFFHLDGPIVHTLYAVDIPDPLPDPPVDRSRMPKPQPLSPILEFPREEFPLPMSCVQLDSKLYFLGGELKTFEPTCPRDVYIFDPAAIAGASDKISLSSLKMAPKMNTGKFYPMAFVARRRIYVLDSLIVTGTGERFEVFDPDARDGIGEWTKLEDPPIRGLLQGYAVINTKVFISVFQDGYGLYCFDLNSHEWSKITRLTPRFACRAEFVEDTLYYCHYQHVLSFRSLAPNSSEEEFFNNYKRMGVSLSPGVLEHQHPALNPSSSLVHMGNRRFCYVLSGCPSDPMIPDMMEHPEKRYVSFTLFDAFTDTYTEGVNTFFSAKYLHYAHFLLKTYGAYSSMLDCLVLPSCRIQDPGNCVRADVSQE